MMFIRSCWAALAIALACALPAVAQSHASREFPPGSVTSLQELPPSQFRDRVQLLPDAARERALGWIRRLHLTELDFHTLHADAEGGIYYADPASPAAPAEGASTPVAEAAAVPVSPFPSTLCFHSRPGAPNVIYLNFTGENVSNTAWNTVVGRTLIPAVSFSIDTDFTTFSDAEQVAIKRIWERVSEDYSPFNVDVTTERPAVFNTRTAHALITRNTDANGDPNPSSDAGGVGYTDVFGNYNYANYRPVWVYYNNLASTESYIGEAASHEVGHNLGLSHDGQTDGTEYYGGHGTGDTSWGPIMGTGYNRNVSQWSKGEYYLANNTQDDLAIIAGKLSYRADDHGSTLSSATPLTVSAGGAILSTTPDTDPSNTNQANKGVLERTTDVDVFSFVTGTGPVSLNVNPWIMPSGTRGGNLDVVAELYNASGVLLLTNNPDYTTYAQIQTNLAEGLYYLLVRNTGVGSPLSSTPTGYTPYASIGQYFISGTVIPSSMVIPPTAELQVTDITLPGVGARQFAVTYADNAGINVGTIDGNDLRITGPLGYSKLARLVSVDVLINGTPRVATYAADPPSGGTWLAADNGTYTISMQTNQVQDTEGASVPAGVLGTFLVNVPVPVYSANMDTDPNWTLDPLWEYGTPAYVGGGPVAGFTGLKIIAYNLAGFYENRLALKYATTPAINCAGSSALTLRFQRWLRIRNGDTALIQVSTNGTSWVDIFNTSKTVADNDWQEVFYSLPAWTAGSPTLRLRWGLASNFSQNDIGWNIDDVMILAGGSVDTTPPTATLNAANLTTPGGPSYSFTVTYSDDTAVQLASINSSNIIVIGPNNFTNQAQLTGVDATSDGTPVNASYSVAAPGGAWNIANNGSYQVILQEGQVGDIYNNHLPETPLGTFTVAIPSSTQALVVTPKVLNVTEGGEAAFTVNLAEAPAQDVTVTIARTSGDPDLIVRSGSSLVFTPANWSVPAPVTLAALPDADQINGSAFFECHASGIVAVTVIATEIDTNTVDFALSASANDPAWGSVSPASGSYVPGTTVQVFANPAQYFTFVQWAGDVSGSNNPLTLTISTNLNIVAQFAELFTTNHPTPLWWLAAEGRTTDFENAVDTVGANGYPLWQSYIAGLDPNNPDSQLRLIILEDHNLNASVLTWMPAPERIYSLEFSTNWANAFYPVPGGSELPSSINSVTNKIDPLAPAVTYRISVRK